MFRLYCFNVLRAFVVWFEKVSERWFRNCEYTFKARSATKGKTNRTDAVVITHASMLAHVSKNPQDVLSSTIRLEKTSAIPAFLRVFIVASHFIPSRPSYRPENRSAKKSEVATTARSYHITRLLRRNQTFRRRL